ncbi:uncharacterized protein HD556DRAFT_1306998 [Suillus plorans]|uniref:Uncharacterized protein n=1 Tax=Suillus plorans TaxID=116603 RepID=A0A9P7DJT0_9AGAM|nr:uncharacterized protein HD556DRAFT_1306998 [Suillus plorans]KAG1796235.1 hypothetical protein HD556DRAFT_1306998 [Suillus plorans]
MNTHNGEADDGTKLQEMGVEVDNGVQRASGDESGGRQRGAESSRRRERRELQEMGVEVDDGVQRAPGDGSGGRRWGAESSRRRERREPQETVQGVEVDDGTTSIFEETLGVVHWEADDKTV